MNLAFTICSNNYLPQAGALCRSFMDLHPGFVFYIVLADEKKDSMDYSSFSPAQILPVAEAQCVDVHTLSAKYHIIEFCTALKPSFFKYFLKQFPEIEQVYYFDPDLFFYGSLLPVMQQLASGREIVITPHIITPIPLDGKKPNENLFLNYGIYNLGFIGIKAGGLQASLFLDWWEERVLANGFDDVANGFFTDQLWINLAPVFFEKVHIEKGRGYNMGPGIYMNANLTPKAV